MNLAAVVVVGVVIAALFEWRAVAHFRRRRVTAGVFNTLSALALLLIAACAGLLGVGFEGYRRLTIERPVAGIEFRQVAAQRYEATLTLPDGTAARYPLAGDQWQIDARLLKWRPFANVLGFDAAYRLDRLSGRYERVEEERTAERTVHALADPPAIDLWAFVRERKLPWFDAYYGSATYVPMADGARYEVSVTQSGVIARPANDVAERAVRQWR